MMRRIMIIGCGGAGKSTLARHLGRMLDLPVIHLDREHWQAGWREPPRAWWAGRVRELVNRPTWIIDGNYGGTNDERLTAADTVIFLDFPRWLCLWRVVKRRIQYHRRTRPDMAAGCPEQLDWAFLRWIWTYRAHQRPDILRKLEAHRRHKRIIVLSNPAQARRFLKKLNDLRSI